MYSALSVNFLAKCCQPKNESSPSIPTNPGATSGRCLKTKLDTQVHKASMVPVIIEATLLHGPPCQADGWIDCNFKCHPEINDIAQKTNLEGLYNMFINMDLTQTICCWLTWTCRKDLGPRPTSLLHPPKNPR